MNIASLLATAARTYGDQPAVAWIDAVALTYAELHARAGRLAAGLRARGLRPGDRVSLAMGNTPAYYETLFACWMAGLVAAPLNCRLHPREMRVAIEDCAAALCFTTPELTRPLEAVLDGLCPVVQTEGAAFEALHAADPMPAAVRQPTDPAWLFYTSGTTGKPKGAIHTHRTLWNTVLNFLADSGAVEHDHILHLAPLSHASGFLGLAYLARGRTNVVLPTGALEAETLARALRAFPPLSFFAVPTVVRRLMDPGLLAPEHVARIHRIFFGGAPMYVADLKRAIAAFGPERLWHLYGQGECPNTITHLPPRLFGSPDDPGYEARLGSVGVPRSGVSVRVVDQAGRDCPPGEIGEVAVQGDNLMAGYWGDPDATAVAIRDGWLHTGDLGRLDARGFLTLVDRSRDLIISGGSNIYPREIEEVLLTHPAVSECAVVGEPDAEWGEVPAAYVVARGPAPDTAELDALCLDNLARYKRPRRYVFVADLPKSSYGKVLKRALRDPAAAPVTGPWSRRAVLGAAAALAAAPAVAAGPFEVWFLGTGTPEPSIDRFGPATLVRTGDRYLIFDAGRGLTIRLSQVFGKMFSRPPGAVTFDALDKVFLTHLHSDHVVGLSDLLLTGWADRLDRPLRLWGPTGTQGLGDGLTAAHAADIRVRRDFGQRFPGVGAAFDVREVGEGPVYREGGVEVSAFLVDHATVAPAFGYRIVAGGRVLVLSGDTRPSENLVRHAQGADVLVHEVIDAPEALLASPQMRIIREHHTTADELGRILARTRPRLAVINHLLQFGPAGEADLLAKVAARYGGPTWVARDLDRLAVAADHVLVERRGGAARRIE